MPLGHPPIAQPEYVIEESLRLGSLGSECYRLFPITLTSGSAYPSKNLAGRQ